ncbi:hypothetical protein [Oribacterium sp. NK2B42]|uniref:hypothetical protein n=1 Tax=Oribacterium sp. NK2B42 TaxID=689781 RepID=UPI000417A42E|nr:hypothetical protein [Oribacterium sp. NK2B42]MBO5599001.1 hypothetical protein [Oribacterium sp.]MBO6310538.1 hypothetical protein [Oribacterium sp.]MBP3803321.1 hypothetical protein [Oribacterium sp.]
MDRIHSVLSHLNGDHQISVYRVNSHLDIEMTNTSVNTFLGMISNGTIDISQVVQINCDKNIIYNICA